MMLAARGAIRASGAGLPYDAEVEYLQSTGTQWINTGYSFNSATDSVELVFELLTTTPNYKWIFGAYDASKRLAIGSGDSESRRTFGYNAWTSYNSSTYYTDGAHIFLADSTGASIDGHNFFAFADFSTTSHILLYSIPLDASTYCANARIWSYKHYRNGVLVRDYIPVRKGAVGYLYDRVSGKLFGNAGTGDFVLGPDVVPVEYIESTGSQWIDTGAPMADRYIFEWLCSDASKDVKLFGNSYAYGRYRDLAIYNSVYRNTNIATKSNSWDRVEIDVTRPSLTITRNGSALGTASNWWAAHTDTESETQYGTALPFGGHINAYGNWYGTNRVTCFSPALGIKLRTRLFEAWNGLDIKERLLPVRVGTEGAMMDVLTRRIYRNAGTGAFSYGNDLKYPIPA